MCAEQASIDPSPRRMMRRPLLPRVLRLHPPSARLAAAAVVAPGRQLSNRVGKMAIACRRMRSRIDTKTPSPKTAIVISTK